MKATILYCDRCIGEGKREVPASLMVWIRTSLGGRTLRLDLCQDHFAHIVGQSTNGARPPSVAPTHEWARQSPKVQAVCKRLLAFSANHERFSLEDAAALLGKDVGGQQVGRALRLLVNDRKLERYRMGVYQRAGFTMPEPASAPLAAAAAVKLIKAHPGIRGAVVTALIGVESHTLWKATLDYLRGEKLVRTKGVKSGMRMYAAA